MKRLQQIIINKVLTVASFAEAWIENNESYRIPFQIGSPPSRRRGLKTCGMFNIKTPSVSPPSRRRGLKILPRFASRYKMGVASFAEAWIEKLGKNIVTGIIKVASFAEAWIEKHPSFGVKYSPASPPSRRRGLKRLVPDERRQSRIVASFAEAWIEKSVTQNSGSITTSPPSRRRGLKNEIYRRTWISCRRLLRGGVD